MFEQMKEIISQLGKLADERPANLGAGYLVDRPELLKHCIRCWAPCGCCVTYMNANAHVHTACEEDEEHTCVFTYEEAMRAIEVFIGAEERGLTVLDSKVDAVQAETEEKSSESLAERSAERSTSSTEGSPETRSGSELETE